MADLAQDRSVSECVLDLRKSSRSDLVSALSALITFPLAFWICGRFPRDISPDIIANLALLILTAVVTSISATRAQWNQIPLELQPASATRWGARIGTLVFLIGGGAYLVGGMASQVKPAMTGSAWLGASIFATGATGILFSMLPTIAAGSITCLLSLRSGAAPSPLVTPLPTEKSPSPSGKALMRIACGFFVFGLLSTGLPIVLANRRIEEANRKMAETHRRIAKENRIAEENRKREELAKAQAAAHSPLPDQLPPVDDFNYEPPKDFNNALAASLKIVATREVPGLRRGAIAEYSPNSRLLAFTDKAENAVKIFDLRKAKVRSTHVPLPPASAMTWAPSGGRLFYLCSDNTCWILEEAGGMVSLPVRFPLNGLTPEWKADNEIRLFRTGTEVARLDLTTLRVQRLQAWSSDTNRAPKALTPNSLAETEKCRLSVRPRVSRLASPLELASGLWSFEAQTAVFASDKDSGRAYPLLNPPQDRGTTFLTSPDASTITIVSSQGAEAHYIGITEGVGTTYSVTELTLLTKAEKNSPLAELAKSGRIDSFICAPLVNPLNGQIIGADANQVKALASFVIGEDGQQSLTVVERYFPIRPGDVAGYLHHWQSRGTVLLCGRGSEDWWSPVLSIAGTELQPGSQVLRWVDPDLELTTCGIEMNGWRTLDRKGPDLPIMNIDDLDKPAPGGSAVGWVLPDDDEDVRKIKEFVKNHHAKVGLRDLDGFVNDYATVVDFNDKGQVANDFIRQDQAAYLPKYDRISETIWAGIAVARNGTGWRVVYDLRSYAVKKDDKKEFNRRVSIVLDLVVSKDGSLKITRERAKVQN